MGFAYVSWNAGSDSTGDGSAANPWKTIDKAVGSGASYALSSSELNTLVLAPGIYRESVTMGVSPTSSGRLVITGDPDGSLFSAGGGTGTTGDVEWVAWSDDVTTINGECLAAAGKSHATVKRIKMTGGGGTGVGCFNLTGSFSDWSFEHCNFAGSTTRQGIGGVNATAGAALNVSFKQCDFAGVGASSTYYGVQIRNPLNSTEYDVAVLFENCNFYGMPGAIQIVKNGGSGSSWATGIRVQQCGFWFCYRAVHVGDSTALTTPIGVYGSTFNFCDQAVIAGSSGQVVEDYNVFGPCRVNLTNITAGTHSKQSARPAWSMHDERIFGGNPRPWGEPSVVSPMLAAGDGGTPPATDAWNQTRPATPSAGSLERDVFETPTNTYIFQVEG